MNTSEKRKNTLEGNTIEGKEVNIGDRINIYGMETSSKDLEFVIKLFAIIIAGFAIAAGICLFYPGPKEELFDYMGFFASGGFVALASLFLVLLIRSKKQSSININ